MSATSRFCGNHLGLFLSPIDQKPWLLLFCVSFVPKQTTKLHQSRMTAASKSACLLPRGLDRRIRKQALVRGLQVVKSVVYRTEYMDRTLRIQSCFTGVELHYSTKRKEDALIRQTQISIRCLGRERKDRKPALTRLPFVSCFRSGVAALLPILVLDFQLHSSEEEDSKSPPVVILLGLGVESLSFV
ncbi:hypothetical protein KY290_029863 [Solanum tuberosum]|uniref:Uncharacterized protein n=2 Tax=Solanum tuberosum TaxID=4113 RepID=A0ABQ7ULX6_SOLTU|nr:hypothetical protein KY284_028715 [Solanum tuberosum]KAH0750631.1 hypothetical protein KY290_029863 [Solanum tuberosum]